MKKIRARLRKLGLENEYGYRAEVKLLPDVLGPKEELIAVSSGIREGRRWYLILSETRLLLLAKPTVGEPRLIEIDRGEILRVEARRGLLFASLIVETEEAAYTFTNVLKKSLPSFTSHFSDGVEPIGG